MKKAVLIAVMFLLCLGMVFLDVCGPMLRRSYAPKVILQKWVYTPEGLLVPKDAVWVDSQTGETYVYLAEKTGKFPEGGYEAVRRDCIVQESEDPAYLLCEMDTYDLETPVVCTSDGKLIPGCKVIPR